MILGSSLWSAITQADETLPPLERNFPAQPDTPRKYEPHRPAVQKHIALELKLDFSKKALHGRASLDFALIAKDLDELRLDAKELEVLGVSICPLDSLAQDSQSVDLSQGQSVEFKWGDDVLTVQGLSKHQKIWNEHGLFRLTIDYRVTSPRAGIYFIDPKDSPWVSMPCIWTQGQDSDAPYWFPCQDDPRLKVTTSIRCEVPKGWSFYANGEKKNDGTWVMSTPHSVYLVALVCGPFSNFEDQWRGKPVRVLLPKVYEYLGDLILKNTVKMMDFYSEYWNFAFPWPQYTQAFVPEFIYGGMENTTLTINTDTVLGDPLYAETLADWRDSLIMHELAHQWFGDWVTCESWSEGWLNEGFATQSEMLWEESLGGPVTGIFYAQKYFSSSYLAEASSYMRPLVSNHYEFPSEIFDRHLYQKGALVLNHLRDLIGETAFRKAVEFYLKSNPFRPVTTESLMRAIEETSGWNPRRFFDNYVYGSGHFDLTFEISLVTGARLPTFRIQVEGKSLLSSGDKKFDTYVAFYGAEGFLGQELVTIDVSQSQFMISAPAGSLFCIVDPRATIIGSVKIRFSDEMARVIMNQHSDHQNGYFAWLSARSMIEKQNLRSGDTLSLIFSWLKAEKCSRARAAGYQLLCKEGALLEVDDLRPFLAGEKSLIAREALLGGMGKLESSDPQEFVNELLKIARNEKEVVAYRKAALAALGTLFSRMPQLRRATPREKVLKAALKLLDESNHFGSVALEASRLVGDLGKPVDLTSVFSLVDSPSLSGRQRLAALNVCAKISQFFPEARREIRPALMRYSNALGPQSLTGALPGLWAQSGDSYYDEAFGRFLSKKSYGLNSFHIPQARRAYKKFLNQMNGLDLSSKIAEIEDLTRRVLKLEFALKAKENETLVKGQKRSVQKKGATSASQTKNRPHKKSSPKRSHQKDALKKKKK